MQSKAVVNRLLTDVSNKIMPQGLIADEVLPTKTVDAYTGLIGSYGGEHMRINTTISAGENGFPRVEAVTYNTDTYSIEAHGLKDFVYPADYANVDKPFDAEKDKTSLLTTQLKLGREKGLADILTATATYAAGNSVTLSGNDQYNNRDHADSTPIEDFATARETIQGKVGMVPNTVVMSWIVYNRLKYHAQLLSEMGYKDNRKGGLTKQELADIMEVQEIMIGESVYNTAKKGQTAAYAPVWNKDILFYVRPKTAGVEQVSLGYKMEPRNKKGFGVYKYNHDEPAGTKKIVTEKYYDDVIAQNEAGYLIKNAVG